MKQLTKAEEQVMQTLWAMGQGMLREIVDTMPEPKTHQNTIATILKILAAKEFIKIETVGRNHCYIPLISREEYSRQSVKQVVQGYFKGSFAGMVSFFANENDISAQELEQILETLKKNQQP